MSLKNLLQCCPDTTPARARWFLGTARRPRHAREPKRRGLRRLEVQHCRDARLLANAWPGPKRRPHLDPTRLTSAGLNTSPSRNGSPRNRSTVDFCSHPFCATCPCENRKATTPVSE